jgi:hypothetical protein
MVWTPGYSIIQPWATSNFRGPNHFRTGSLVESSIMATNVTARSRLGLRQSDVHNKAETAAIQLIRQDPFAVHYQLRRRFPSGSTPEEHDMLTLAEVRCLSFKPLSKSWCLDLMLVFKFDCCRDFIDGGGLGVRLSLEVPPKQPIGTLERPRMPCHENVHSASSHSSERDTCSTNDRRVVPVTAPARNLGSTQADAPVQPTDRKFGHTANSPTH